MLVVNGDISLTREVLLGVSVVMAYMLISPIRMFALKFKGFGWQGNEIRYSFIALCVVLIAAFTRYAVPAIILLYIIISATEFESLAITFTTRLSFANIDFSRFCRNGRKASALTSLQFFSIL